MYKPKIIDLFCGVGGFSLGFEQAGFESVLAIDMWKDAVDTYNHNREHKVAININIEDYTDDMIDELLKKHQIDGIVGGPPCQGFSTVGTRDINDPRNHLYKEFFRFVKKVRPKFFVIENVKGLLTLNKGLFKEDIIKSFTELGYTVSEPQVLDAADHGVPQRRKRVIFVGMLEDEFLYPAPDLIHVSALEALSDLPFLDHRNDYPHVFEYEMQPQNEYQRLMRENSDVIYNHDITNHTEQTIEVISKIKDGGSIKDLPPEYWEIRKYNKSFQRMNSSLPSHTIDTGHRNYFHYKENRVPTVRESARIQSFPDNFVFLGSKTSQYKQVGNAVPPLLGKAIANEVKLKLNTRYLINS